MSGVGIGKQPPEYFERIRAESAKRWDQLEADPPLAGPWHQLFAQVQSPRHVLSELLQNADDAGAKQARVRVENGKFQFEHDGTDFNADQFQSLCRFGYSNKRILHTIGFRGIGFKSTFSLGRAVEVHTPTLSVSFSAKRFTEPVWIKPQPEGLGTLVVVKIHDDHKLEDVERNFEEWLASPASLLFFNNIQRLEIAGTAITRRTLGAGPVRGSEIVELTAKTKSTVLVARSNDEKFPEEAIEEIRAERHESKLTLPPCRVEIVLGLQGEQQLYSVLPAGCRTRLPFSCNAPFMQRPSRMDIKDPSTSPTNRWLLGRAGELAASVFHAWIGAVARPLSDRAGAYELLPIVNPGGDGTGAAATRIVTDAFMQAVNLKAVLLDVGGHVHPVNTCIAAPRELHHIWTSDVLREVVADAQSDLLAQEVRDHLRTRLQQWEWLTCVDEPATLARIERMESLPRPASSEALARLWRLIDRLRAQFYIQDIKYLPIVPVRDDDRLRPASESFRLGAARRNIRKQDLEFLLSDVYLVDETAIEKMAAATEPARSGGSSGGSVASLLRDLGLTEATPLGMLLERAAYRLARERDAPLAGCVRLAHILAALDADAPKQMPYVSASGDVRVSPHESVLVRDSTLDDLAPEAWLAARQLHEAYDSPSGPCSDRQWRTWVASPKSQLRSFCAIEPHPRTLYGKEHANQWLRERGIAPPAEYRYKNLEVRITDFDFDPVLLAFWRRPAAKAGNVWVRVVEHLLRGAGSEWSSLVYATAIQTNGSTTKPHSVPAGPIPAQWVLRLREAVCLPDTHGRPRVPAELLMRTPDTEPLQGVEPFVDAPLDNERTRPLLELLGVRSTPANAGSIIERIVALSKAPAPPIRELGKWYDALDRLLGRRRPESELAEIRRVFAESPLALGASGEWFRSGEVFQRLGDDDPKDLPVLHPDFAELAMWSLLGVAERPTADRLIAHARGWASGRRLDGGELRLIRSLIARHPARVWSECGHWPSIDGAWLPTDAFNMILFDDAALRVRDLFPSVKRKTADGRALDENGRTLPFVRALRDLGGSLQLRVGKPQTLGPPRTCVWASTLGSLLRRVELDQPEQQATVRRSAERLAESQWQVFRSLSVTPYLDGVPAGQEDTPDVVWQDKTVFVKHASPARLLDPVVAEIARSLPGQAIEAAIRACYERSPEFVTEFLNSRFKFALAESIEAKLETGPQARVDARESIATSNGNAASVTPPSIVESLAAAPAVAAAVQETVKPEPQTVATPVAPHRPAPSNESTKVSLIHRFAIWRGFRPGADPDEFIHPDGSRLVRQAGPLPWHLLDNGKVLARYLVLEQSLARGGVEFDAEVWGHFKQWPSATALILLSEDGRPQEIRGDRLIQMVAGEALSLVPATFRLVKTSAQP